MSQETQGRERKRQGKLVLYVVTNVVEMVPGTVRADLSCGPEQTAGWVHGAAPSTSCLLGWEL